MKVVLLFSLLLLNLFGFSQKENFKSLVINITNANSRLSVPEGKKWIINNVISNYDLNSNCDIVIVLKKLNDVIYTDLNSSIVGPRLFSSTVSLFGDDKILPLFLEEKTTIEFLIYEKCTNSETNYTSRKPINKNMVINIKEITY